VTGHVAPGNDYRALRSMPDGVEPTVAVIIPIYNRTELLANVLGGLTRQTYAGDFEVIVVDDGSQEDVGVVVDGVASGITVRLLRQERDGFGLARARNLGLSATDADVVVFLDADCIPTDEWLEAHVAWHRKASNLVVTGSRRHVDDRCDPGTIADGTVDLAGIARGVDDEHEDLETDDWRGLVYRRSQRLLLGDAGFRAAIGGNSSMRREMVLEVGGADEEFRAWGGEDTELAWRLWNAGAFVIPESRATIYHQTYGDPPDADERRREARKRALPLIIDRVPHRFYRKEPSHLYTVPKVSWIVHVGTGDEAARTWREVSRASYTDSELILVGDDESVGIFVSASAASRDLTVLSSFSQAVLAARGEMLAIVDGRCRFDRRTLARAMRRFDDPRVSAVRVGYRFEAGRLLRLEDLRSIDAADGIDGLPFFGLIKRRELMKDRNVLDDPGRAWTSALDRSRTELLITGLVELPAGIDPVHARRVPGLIEIRAAGAAEVARGVRQAVRSTRSGSAEPTGEPPSDDPRVGIEYVGFTGQSNLGDDAMFAAVRALFPWADVGVNVANPRAVMLGGGTLINSGKYYLNKIRGVDGPNMERVVFGTGVRSPDYWGESESFGDWEPFITSSLAVGLRGPASAEALRSWGYTGPLEIIGDPALSLARPEDVERIDGRVVICPLHTAGECWGGDDAVVRVAFAELVARLKSQGRDVVMMTAHPSDDRWALEIMRDAGHPDLSYLAGYDDLDMTLELISSADLVVGERLHAIVLAAAMTTPFVGVEYRPKLRDFAGSLEVPELLVRTDQMNSLETVVGEALERLPDIRAHIATRAENLVSRQRRLAADIESTIVPGA